MDIRGADERQRSILISGVASGIGLATARLFAAKGWFVGGLDVNASALSELRDELGAGSSMLRQLDVADRPALLAAVNAFGEATDGRLDVLFSNAGMDTKGPFETMPWDRVVNVNLLGAMSLVHSAIPLLKATQGSLCLSTASASAIFGTAHMAVYSATKHALKGITEALAVEPAPAGVRAADILPGIIDTGMLSAADKAKLPKEGMWRVLSAEAVAQVVWDAYVGDRVHWYVPTELAAYDVEVTKAPERERDRRLSGKA